MERPPLPSENHRYEIHAIIEGELTIYFADAIDFKLDGFVNMIPKLIVNPTGRWEPKNLEITLPNERIQIITEYKPVESTPKSGNIW